MPKIEIDYSNTVFYKIFCKDANVSDLYVGHTTNFVQRKHAHKQGCKNPKSSNYNCKLYNAIRLHGGWDNWIMEIIAFHNCNDHYEARIKEQEYFLSCKATLNSIEPMPKPKPKPTKNVFDTSELNYMQTLTDELPHPDTNFSCQVCHYYTNKNSSYQKHLITAKHHKKQNTLEKLQLVANEHLMCVNCNRKYTSRVGLWKHKKQCASIPQIIECPNIKQPSDENQIKILTDTVIDLIKQNNEFKELMIKQNNMILELVKSDLLK